MSHSHIDDLSLSLLHLPLASRNTSTHELSSTSSPSDSSHIPHPQLTQPSGIPSIPPPTAPTLLTSLSHLFSLACTLPDHLPFHTGTHEAMLPPLTVAFAEDVVEIKHEGVTSYAIVTRCWADEQNPEAVAEAARIGLQYTPLKPGQLEVLHPAGHRTEVLESSVTIVDRGFLLGDLVRMNGGVGQAGIITSLDVSLKLQRVLSGEVLSGWFDAKEVVAAARIGRGDHVVHGCWVGMVEEVFEMAMVESASGPARRICDTGNMLSVGVTTDALLMDRAPMLQGMLSPGGVQRILDVQQIVVAVNWLCMSQLVDPSVLNTAVRPKRYWCDIDELALVRATSDHLHSVGDKVKLRDPTSHPIPIEHQNDPESRGHHILVVTRSRSTATVLWQDGTTTTSESPWLEHCTNIDEDVDVFPGDVGVFSESNRVGVVQKMDSKKRTVQLRWLGTDEEEVVSGLEFDPHGPPPEVYGVRRQDFVLITKGTNGVAVPTVPRLGESELLTGQWPSVTNLRVDLSTIGLHQAALLASTPAPSPQSGTSLTSIDWYGEVVSLLLDGRVLVQFPSGLSSPFPLSQIYHLDDGLDPEGMMGMGMAEEDEFMDEAYVEDGDEDASMTDRSWETDGEEEGEDGGMEVRWPEADEVPMDVKERGWADEGEPVVSNGVSGTATKEVGMPMPVEEEEEESWQRFTMLEEAPQDHHFMNEVVDVPSKAYMARVQKEYSVLASSLPPNILVRAYENRSDLLRCLIIGPLGTPFQNAPFLFDLYLSPTKFPLEPPSVYFHSWAGGTRISPNLYAEGKVCLSLLNTWHGDKTESWSAARSSILQVLVSIQGLIMVEEPYYTEPGFDKQSTTTEGKIASDLYNERTFVLTRAFVKRAIEYPPSGFVAEIKAYYYDGLVSSTSSSRIGALAGITAQSRLLLEESEAYHAEDEESRSEGRGKRSAVIPSMNVLTEGAVLSLRRTTAALEGLVGRDSESISNKVGNVTHGTVGDETLIHQATTLASHSIVYAKSWVGLAGTVESTPQPSVGSLINETRDLAASVLGTVGSVVAASTPEKAKEVASEAKDAAQDTASSAQQQHPVGYVASARDLAASAIGTVQGIVASGAKKVDQQVAGSNGSLSGAASQAVGGAKTTASQIGDAFNNKKDEASRILQDAQNTAGTYAGAAVNKAADTVKKASDATKQKADQAKKQV